MKKSACKRILACILTMLMMFSVASVVVVSAETTGTTDDGFVYSVSSNGVTITGYTGDATELVIPSEIEGDPITRIGNSAFYNILSLERVEIPSNVKEIYSMAFYCCPSLRNVTISEGVEYIGGSAFSFCESLESVYIPESVANITGNPFANCASITEIKVAENNAVYDSRDNCNAIIQTATNKLISGCQNTKIPNSVYTIADSAFSGCDTLSSIVIPEGVAYLESQAFNGCHSLTSIMIPSTVWDLGEDYRNAFPSCSKLKEIKVSENNPVYDSRDNCNAIIHTKTNKLILGCDNTVIPDSVATICYEAFSWCKNIDSITIPMSVTKVESGAFNSNIYRTDPLIVYYCGTREQWNEIAIEDSTLNNYATVYYKYPVAEMAGNSITLSGNIGVNFFVNFSYDVLADRTAKVVFTCNNVTTQIPVSSGIKTENGYKFTCELPAKNMTSQVTCKVASSVGNSERFAYSVKDYAEVILADPDTYGEDTVELVKSMLNYGAAAQTYFGYNTNDLANDTEYMTDTDRTVAEKDFSNLSYTLTQGSGDVTYYGTALSLKSEVTIKHYFTLAEGVDVNALTVTVNGKNAKLVKSGGYYQLTIPDIAAHNLYNDYVVRIGDMSLSYCAMDYATMAQQTGDAELMKVMYALDAYAQNAQAYQN